MKNFRKQPARACKSKLASATIATGGLTAATKKIVGKKQKVAEKAVVAAKGKDKKPVKVQAQEDESRASYEQALAPMLIGPMDFETCIPKHAYLQQQTNNAAGDQLNASVIRRIQQDLRQLENNLPASWSSFIAVRFDERHLNLLRFLITGPADTPYQNGIFLFDLKFPSSYPTQPPSVRFLTTGNGTVRMNPNLYECGYVCLSLLNTYSGNSDERWNPVQSTLLQVMVSLQGLVLTREPYYNEPGFPKNDPASEAYSRDIRHYVLKWAMIDMLDYKSDSTATQSSSVTSAKNNANKSANSADNGFKDLIVEHFRWKRDELNNQQRQQWIAMDSTLKSPFNTLKKHLDQL
jgi:ubiquitin-protein ligase